MTVTGLGHYFRDHLCFADTGTSKGDTIALMMQRHGLQAPVYVGDTDGDCAAAAHAGTKFAYAAYGFGKVPSFDWKLESVRDLIPLFV